MSASIAARRLLQRSLNHDLQVFRNVGCRFVSGADLGSTSNKNVVNPRLMSHRHLTQVVNGRQANLVDTLAMARRLEANGFPSKQAEAVTALVVEVLNGSLDHVSGSLVSKVDMQTMEMAQEAALAKYKSEVQNSQEHNFSLLQREDEKLRTDIDRLRSELRYEIDKQTAGQRLDLNLEKGRIRDELQQQSQETSDLTNKLDREIHLLKTQLEAAKYEVIKYCIGTVVSVTAVGLGLLRLFM